MSQNRKKKTNKKGTSSAKKNVKGRGLIVDKRFRGELTKVIRDETKTSDFFDHQFIFGGPDYTVIMDRFFCDVNHEKHQRFGQCSEEILEKTIDYKIIKDIQYVKRSRSKVPVISYLFHRATLFSKTVFYFNNDHYHSRNPFAEATHLWFFTRTGLLEKPIEVLWDINDTYSSYINLFLKIEEKCDERFRVLTRLSRTEKIDGRVSISQIGNDMRGNTCYLLEGLCGKNTRIKLIPDGVMSDLLADLVSVSFCHDYIDKGNGYFFCSHSTKHRTRCFKGIVDFFFNNLLHNSNSREWMYDWTYWLSVDFLYNCGENMLSNRIKLDIVLSSAEKVHIMLRGAYGRLGKSNESRLLLDNTSPLSQGFDEIGCLIFFFSKMECVFVCSMMSLEGHRVLFLYLDNVGLQYFVAARTMISYIEDGIVKYEIFYDRISNLFEPIVVDAFRIVYSEMSTIYEVCTVGQKRKGFRDKLQANIVSFY